MTATPGPGHNSELSPRPFADVLRELSAGATYAELTQALGEVVDAVIAQRKPGSLTLTLKINPNGENSVRVEDSVAFKAPSPPRSSSVFFAKDGALMRDDPRQERLPLRSVERPAEPPRTLPETPAQPIRSVESA